MIQLAQINDYIKLVLLFSVMFALLVIINFLEVGYYWFLLITLLFVLIFALVCKKINFIFGYGHSMLKSTIGGLPCLFFINPLGSNIVMFPSSQDPYYTLYSFSFVFFVFYFLGIMKVR